jgi:hypothetical protein
MDPTVAGEVGVAFMVLLDAIYMGWRFGRLEQRVGDIDIKGPAMVNDRLARLEQHTDDIDAKGCARYQGAHV